MQSELKQHWNGIYGSRRPDEVSWHQLRLRRSLEMIEHANVGHAGCIVDVGGGLSTLADDLLSQGYSNITVLDISAAALAAARARLGSSAGRVTWIEADILQAQLPANHYDVWHDRAVFHFLTREADRKRYVEIVRQSVRPGGHVIVATFGPEGPQKCSNLPTMRYAPGELHLEFGPGFELLESALELHVTPGGKEQQFIYCHCRRLPD